MITFNPYGWVLHVRHWLYDTGRLPSVAFDFPVLCVGNVTVGGTGKTPLVAFLVQSFLNQGYCPVVLSRGYGRKTKGFRYVAEADTATMSGDEPVQLKRTFPHVTVAVCEDRVAGIRRLVRNAEVSSGKAPDVVLLDDAFQYRRLRATCSILLEDFARPIAQDRLLPFGRLRDLPQAARRAHCLVVTKCPPVYAQTTPETHRLLTAEGQSIPVFFAFIEYEPLPLPEGAAILLVTGIARPEPLEAHLKAHYNVRMHLRFPDHHAFSAGDTARLAALRAANPTWHLVTTEKDAVRLPFPDALPVRIRTSAPANAQQTLTQFLNETALCDLTGRR